MVNAYEHNIDDDWFSEYVVHGPAKNVSCQLAGIVFLCEHDDAFSLNIHNSIPRMRNSFENVNMNYEYWIFAFKEKNKKSLERTADSK